MKTVLLAVAAAAALAAQPKLLINAQTDTRSASGGLEAAVHALLAAQPQPAWIGYSVPSVRTYDGLGCDYVRDGGGNAGLVHLEPPDHMLVLMRVEENKVTRLRTVSPDCEIDAGGVPFHWLSDVQPAQSIAMLASLAPTSGNAMHAIAMHADPAADQALERFLAPDQPETLRARAVSYFGSTRGPSGFDVLKRVIANDADIRVRERAVSSLGNSRDPQTTDLLTSTARTNADPRLRAAAVSALGRKSGGAVVSTLTEIAENDSDKNVKRRALSALQNMPDGEGVPTLIRLAKTAKDDDTRKQAMQSLEHSRDPRTLTFFEEVLKH
jgi:HEAT repeat protein